MYICWCLTSNNSQYIQISNHWDLNLLWIILQLSTLASDKDTVCIGFTWQGHLWPSAGQPRDSSWPVLWLFPLNDHQWSQVEGVWPRKHDGNKSKTSVSHPLHPPPPIHCICKGRLIKSICQSLLLKTFDNVHVIYSKL